LKFKFNQNTASAGCKEKCREESVAVPIKSSGALGTRMNMKNFIPMPKFFRGNIQK
jgi:hypothetical protein